jgi:hypothetical protein
MDNPLRRKRSFTSRLAQAFLPKSGGKKLSKLPPNLPILDPAKMEFEQFSKQSPHDSPMEYTPAKPGPVNFYNKKPTAINAQTGELWDEAEILHSILRRDSMDSMNSIKRRELQDKLAIDSFRKSGEAMIASLPAGIWAAIKDHLNPADAANLAMSSKTLLTLVGGRPFGALNINGNHQFKIDFLIPMDRYLPDHLLCFPCAVYHLRIQKGKERLKAADVLNPIYNCPDSKLLSRHRLIPNHNLPFTFIQLVFRAEKYGPQYGIPLDALDRRYRARDGDWTHQTRFLMHRGHMLLRVVSKCFATAGLPPAGQRQFLFSREDYTPYFSVCAHWRDGELMNLCKCALSHIPVPKSSPGQLLQGGKLAHSNPRIFVTQCNDCRPMRRCPDCPTEYLIEFKLEEDRADPDPRGRFKQCMVVTRWSDLGDGRDPGKGEWAAVNGEGKDDSFKMMGRRGISGNFESHSGVGGPVQRIVSLNPKGERKGEESDDWY